MDPPRYNHPKIAGHWLETNGRQLSRILTGATHCCFKHTLLHTPSVPTVKFYGQAERAISNGKLNALLRLHIRPIDVVVFHGPS